MSTDRRARSRQMRLIAQPPFSAKQAFGRYGGQDPDQPLNLLAIEGRAHGASISRGTVML